ncbi:MAG: hypothetical protein IT196_26660 [Acidimicrobiales bacterium]|nr:hypothetical protein [Acidimicrobiales bacterium]
MIFARRSARWLVPAALVVGTAAAVAVPSLLPAGADPVPVLPELTAAQLLAKVQQADVQTFSGSVTYEVDLGLPDLGGFGGSGAAPSTILELLSGSTTAQLSVDGTDRQRIALDGEQSETHWIHNGDDVWSWDSSTGEVAHLDVGGPGLDAAKADDLARKAMPAFSPETVADLLLARVGLSTEVRVQTPGYVAGRPVYELVLSPRDAASTIDDVVVAVDASTGMPLRLRVDGRDTGEPVLQIGFTSISYDSPNPSTFTFTPPPGATVIEADDPGDLLPFSSGLADGRIIPDGIGAAVSPDDVERTEGTELVGTDWSTMVVVSDVGVPPQLAVLLDDAPALDGPGGEAKVIRTRLLNVVLLADGRLAVAALEPTAMIAALPA